jgi:hypothetical protein
MVNNGRVTKSTNAIPKIFILLKMIWPLKLPLNFFNLIYSINTQGTNARSVNILL